MLKLLVKLAVTAFLVNAAFRIGSEYFTHYQFRDAVRSAAITRQQSGEELRSEVLALASDYGVPQGDETLFIEQDERHTIVEGSYEKPILLLPNYEYRWRFDWAVEGYVVPVAPVSPSPK